MKLVVMIGAAALLLGCTTPQTPKVEIVTVDKPIPIIPKPPKVPSFISRVDQLTLADLSDPGKVGQAYKYDTMQLRQLLKIHEQILIQYEQSSDSFDDLKSEIDKMYSDITKK